METASMKHTNSLRQTPRQRLHTWNRDCMLQTDWAWERLQASLSQKVQAWDTLPAWDRDPRQRPQTETPSSFAEEVIRTCSNQPVLLPWFCMSDTCTGDLLSAPYPVLLPWFCMSDTCTGDLLSAPYPVLLPWFCMPDPCTGDLLSTPYPVLLPWVCMSDTCTGVLLSTPYPGLLPWFCMSDTCTEVLLITPYPVLLP